MEMIITDPNDYRIQFNFYRKVHSRRTATNQNKFCHLIQLTKQTHKIVCHEK